MLNKEYTLIGPKKLDVPVLVDRETEKAIHVKSTVSQMPLCQWLPKVAIEGVEEVPNMLPFLKIKWIPKSWF